MVTSYYLAMFAIAVVLMLAYLFLWHKHFDAHIMLIFVLVPISNLGYAMVATAQSLEAAILAYKVAYIGGCYLLLTLMLAVFALCFIEVDRKIRFVLLCLSTLAFLCVLTIALGDTPLHAREYPLLAPV